MSHKIIVTTGIYDLIKEQIRRKKVSREEENRLITELKHAKQVLRRELPEDAVTVNRKVTIKDHTENKEETYLFVETTKEKKAKGKFSIMSQMGIATVGYKVGDVIDWPFPDGERKIEITNVEVI